MCLDFDSSLATYADYMGLSIFLEVADRHRINMSALGTEDVDGLIFKHTVLPNGHTFALAISGITVDREAECMR